MKKEEYNRILKQSAVPSGLRLNGAGFNFQQDNETKNSSELCKDYLERKADEIVLKNIIWPPRSPDINPI